MTGAVTKREATTHARNSELFCTRSPSSVNRFWWFLVENDRTVTFFQKLEKPKVKNKNTNLYFEKQTKLLIPLECGISNFAGSLHLVWWIIAYQHLPKGIWKIHGVNLLWLNFGGDPTSMVVEVPMEVGSLIWPGNWSAYLSSKVPTFDIWKSEFFLNSRF